jgi:rsbT co-antagonist protein RsbR
MYQTIHALKEALEQRVSQVLHQHAMTNRGTFPPFRLPSVARTIIDGLLSATDDGTAARSLGQSLNQQGIGLFSLLEAHIAVVETISEQQIDELPQVLTSTSRFFSVVIQGFVAAEAEEIARQRDDMERAFLNTVSQQREQEEQFNNTISELSTPIIPVHENVLILPLIGAISSRRATEITERLLEAIAANQAEIVIIDITGVPIIDTRTANHLLMTTRAANLLGSEIVLVGVGAEIAQTIVHLGVELHGLVTLANLQSGIAYALKRMGLGIQPLLNQKVVA